jgi:hypothetical protein
MSEVSMEAMWAALISIALVAGGLLLLALFLRVTTLGRRDSRRPRRPRRFGRR